MMKEVIVIGVATATACVIATATTNSIKSEPKNKLKNIGKVMAGVGALAAVNVLGAVLVSNREDEPCWKEEIQDEDGNTWRSF